MTCRNGILPINFGFLLLHLSPLLSLLVKCERPVKYSSFSVLLVLTVAEIIYANKNRYSRENILVEPMTFSTDWCNHCLLKERHSGESWGLTSGQIKREVRESDSRILNSERPALAENILLQPGASIQSVYGILYALWVNCTARGKSLSKQRPLFSESVRGSWTSGSWLIKGATILIRVESSLFVWQQRLTWI